MFKAENFIYFLTVNGFFIGLIFAIMKNFEPFNFLFVVFIVTSFFYMLGLASSGIFIKYISAKQLFYLDKVNLEKAIDYQIGELEKREAEILEAHYFIQDIEDKELKLYKNKKGSKKYKK